jgi:hypothetical protein
VNRAKALIDREINEGRRAYYSGLSPSTAAKRKAQFKKQADMPDNDPSAYKPAPGDADAKTKPSKYTKAYHDRFGEAASDTALDNKAKKSGISKGTLKKVYNRGVAAWKSGHRPGTTPSQWGMARVNSFITGGKTRTTADKDLWKGKKKG